LIQFFDDLTVIELQQNAVGEQDITALHNAASTSRVPIVKALLSNAADPNALTRHLLTPLHAAAASGSAECCRELLKAGAYVNSADDQYESPLHKAARHGHVAVLRVLLEHGADGTVENEEKKLALDLAKGRKELEELLKQYI
jgi:ankyrin repeat protein